MGLWKKIKKSVKGATNWAVDKGQDALKWSGDTAVKVGSLGTIDSMDEEKELLKNIATLGMYGESKAAREMQEQQYKEQQAAAAQALTDAKKAEQTAIAEAAAKTEEERKKRMLYGRASTFVSSGLGGSMSSRKTLLGA